MSAAQPRGPGALWPEDSMASFTSSMMERDAMREELTAVRATLNALQEQGHTSTGTHTMPALAPVLSDIARKLDSIEGLYSSLTGKLERVDMRFEESERSIRGLQNLAAGTIHETARLVDYVGRGTPSRTAGAVAGAPSTGGRARATAAPPTPPPATVGAFPRSPLPALEYVPGHLTATIQQHAAQIHKLIAGLDFLEAHIIRQDTAVEGLLKHSTVGGASPDSRAPSEITLRVHDMGEMVNKLRSHMYKVEKRSGSSEQALIALQQQVAALEARLAGMAAGGPSAAAPGTLAERPAADADVKELRSTVLALQQQVAAMQQQQPGALGSGPQDTPDASEVRRQLAYLMGVVPALLADNEQLKEGQAAAARRIDELSSTCAALKQQAQQGGARGSRSSSAGAGAGESGSGETLRGPPAAPAAEVQVAGLQSQLDALRGGLEVQLEELREKLDAAAASAADALQRSSEAAVLAEEAAEQVAAGQAAATERTQAGEDAAAEAGERRLALLQENVMAMMAGAEQEQAGLREQLAAFASQFADEQLALSSRLDDLRTAQRAVGAEAGEALEAARSELQAQVETVMEALKERVEQGMQQMGTQVDALQQQLTSAAEARELGEQRHQRLHEQLSALQQEAATAAETRADTAQQYQQLQEQLAALLQQVAVLQQAVTAASAAQEADLQQQGEKHRELQGQLSALQHDLAAAAAARDAEHSQQLSGLQQGAQEQAAALEELRAELVDAAERGEYACSTLENMRSELLVLTGQADVVSSRLEMLESAVGLEAPAPLVASPASITAASRRSLGAVAEERDDGGADGPAAAGAAPDASSPRRRPSSLSGRGRGAGGLLELVAELRTRLVAVEAGAEVTTQEVEQVLERVQACATQEQLAGLQEAQDTGSQVTSQLSGDLRDLSGLVSLLEERLAAAELGKVELAAAVEASQRAAAEQSGAVGQLGARVEELQAKLQEQVQARVAETATAVASLTTRLQRDYITREQLGAIFSAREDMKRAVAELATVFDTGRLMRQASDDVPPPAACDPPGGGSGSLSPKLVSALEDLAGKQAAMEQQLHLALYRTEHAARADQLASLQQAMVTLELQFKRAVAAAGGPGQGAQAGGRDAAAGGVGAGAAVAELCARVEALEAAVGAAKGVRAAAGAAAAAVQTPAKVARGASTAAAGGEGVRVLMQMEDPDDADSPVRVRLLAAPPSDQATAFCAAGLPPGVDGEDAGPVPPAGHDSPGEPSLDHYTGAAAAVQVAQELVDLRAAVAEVMERCGELAAAAEWDGKEQQRLAEGLAAVQEQIGSWRRVQLEAHVTEAAREGVVAALEERLAELEGRVAAAEGTRGRRMTEADEDTVIALVAGLAALEAEVGAVGGRVVGLEAAVTAAGELAEAAPQAAELDVAAAARAAAAAALAEALPELLAERVPMVVRAEVAEALAVHRADQAAEADQGADRRWMEEAVEGACAAAEQAGKAAAALSEDFRVLQVGVETLADRVRDVDTVRDQVESLSSQVRNASIAAADASAAAAAAMAAAESARSAAGAACEAVSASNSATVAAVAGMYTPNTSGLAGPSAVRTPRASTSSTTGAAPLPPAGPRRSYPGQQLGEGSSPQAGQGPLGSGFLSRLVDVVRRQSSRLHAQYSDAEEAGAALAQVDNRLVEVEERLADVRDMSSAGFAEGLVAVLEQVAELRMIGSQTHPAVQQMVLQHENKLEQIAEQLHALGATLPDSASGAPLPLHALPGTGAPASLPRAELSALCGRVARLEAQLGAAAEQHAAMDRAIAGLLATSEAVRLQARAEAKRAGSDAGSEGAAAPNGEAAAAAAEGGVAVDGGAAGAAAALQVAALAARVQQLDGALAAQLAGLRQEVAARLAGADAAQRDAGGAGASGRLSSDDGGRAEGAAAESLAALDARVRQLQSATGALKNRLLAVQEYVDSTQGMLREAHVGLGSLTRRMDALEADGGAGPGGAGGDGASFKELRSDLSRLDGRLHAVERSALEAAHELAGLAPLRERLGDAEGRLADAAATLGALLEAPAGSGGGSTSGSACAALGGAMPLPALSAAVRQLQRREAGRLDSAAGALSGLVEALGVSGRIAKESTANPFKAISAAVNNPVVVALDKKLEAMRGAVEAAGAAMLEDLRREQRERERERDADWSGSAGSRR